LLNDCVCFLLLLRRDGGQGKVHAQAHWGRRRFVRQADRFDQISSELHKANHTIATVFPDQVQFSMQEGDGEGFPKAIGGIDLSNFKFPALEGLSMGSQSASRGTSPVPKRGA
jgi:hypothetical protein